MRRAAILWILILASANAIALPGAMSDLKDVCGHVASEKELRLINATALMVANDPDFIQYNSSNNTYSITNEAFTHAGASSVCENSPLYDEPHINADAARTGFLIAPDKIMTAAHASPGDFTPNHWLIVFRKSKTSGEDPNCSNFTWSDIPAANVYHPNGAVANTYSKPPETKYDYAVIQLSRAVTDRQPVRIRRSGRGRAGDLLVSAGYPNRGGEKIDTNGVLVLPNAQQGFWEFDEDLQYSVRHSGSDALYNIHGLLGSSGSPIYNVDDDVVESAISYGTSSFINVPDGGCASVVQGKFIFDFNGRTVDIQGDIPRSEVLVRPLDYVEHVLDTNPSGQLFSNDYYIESARAGGGEVVRIGSVVGPSGNSALYPVVTASIGSGDYVVPSGGLQFDVSADVGAVSACGIHDYEINVKDVSNDYNNIIRHHFEIGMREFSLTPDDVWEVRKLGSPYDDVKTYSIRNVRPTPTHVMVSTYAGYPFKDFLRVNGGGSVSLNLGAAGSSTDSATINVSINQAAAENLSVGDVHRGRISFYHQPFICTVPWQSSYVNRDINFVRGRQVVQSTTDGDYLPIPTGNNYGDPIRFEVDLSGLDSRVCAADVNLTVGIPRSLIGAADVAATLKMVLIAPSGLSKVLWDGNQIPSQSYVVDADFGSGWGIIPGIYLDDQSTPPMGGALLSSFNGRRISGKWYLEVSTSSVAGTILAGPVKMEFLRSDRCLAGQ